MSDWIEHDGKGMPVDGETEIWAKFRDGIKIANKAKNFSGSNPDIDLWIFCEAAPPVDITHYKIIE